MQEGAHQKYAAPKDPCITREKGKLINRKGGDVDVRFEGLKVISVGNDGGRETIPVP